MGTLGACRTSWWWQGGPGREPTAPFGLWPRGAVLWLCRLVFPSSCLLTPVHPCQISMDKSELLSPWDCSRVSTEQLTPLRREAVGACHGWVHLKNIKEFGMHRLQCLSSCQCITPQDPFWVLWNFSGLNGALQWPIHLSSRSCEGGCLGSLDC